MSGLKNLLKHKGLLIALKILLAILVVLAIIWVNRHAADDAAIVSFIEQYGYIGILLLSAVSGFNVIVPIPIVAFYPFFIETGLSPLLTIGIMAAGLTLGDLLGFIIGNQGRKIVSPKSGKMIHRIERLRERHHLLPYVALYVYAAFIPLPNELIVIPMAFLGFRLRGIFLAVLLGNATFTTLAAFGFTQLFG